MRYLLSIKTVIPRHYQPIWPVYIADWDAKALKAL